MLGRPTALPADKQKGVPGDSEVRRIRSKSIQRSSNSDLQTRTSCRPLEQSEGWQSRFDLALAALPKDRRVLFPKAIDRQQGFLHRGSRLPPGVAVQFGKVTHINQLVSGPAALVRVGEAVAGERADLLD